MPGSGWTSIITETILQIILEIGGPQRMAELSKQVSAVSPRVLVMTRLLRCVDRPAGICGQAEIIGEHCQTEHTGQVGLAEEQCKRVGGP